jgi:hypothetical protein
VSAQRPCNYVQSRRSPEEAASTCCPQLLAGVDATFAAALALTVFARCLRRPLSGPRERPGGTHSILWSMETQLTRNRMAAARNRRPSDTDSSTELHTVPAILRPGRRGLFSASGLLLAVVAMARGHPCGIRICVYRAPSPFGAETDKADLLKKELASGGQR